MLKSQHMIIALLLFATLAMASHDVSAQTVVHRLKLGPYSEDITFVPTFVPRGATPGQFAILEGFNVMSVPIVGEGLARKLFDLRSIPIIGIPLGITYVRSRDLFAVNDSHQRHKIFLVNDKGLLVNIIEIQYKNDYMPAHVEGMGYILSNSPIHPNHIIMVTVDPVGSGRRLEVIGLDGQVDAEISTDLDAEMSVAFLHPDLLVVAGYSWVGTIDFDGKFIVGPVIVGSGIEGDEYAFEGVAVTQEGSIYTVGRSEKLVAFDSNLVIQPQADRIYTDALASFYPGVQIYPEGLAWNSNLDEHVLGGFIYDDDYGLQFASVSHNLRTAAFSVLNSPQPLMWVSDLTYLPDTRQIAARVLTSGWISYIGLFNENGSLDRLIDIDDLGLGWPESISYILPTQQLAVSFSSSPNLLYILSFESDEGEIDYYIDLTSAPIESVGEVAFFNPDHSTGGQFLIFEPPIGGPSGTHRAIVTDFNGVVLSEFDYLSSLNV